ncbi:MAG: hypothetical protein V1676_03180 [Candidatus Diapherotrites archaeon]
MARKGESKGQKRLSVAKARFLPRKSSVWAIRVRAGPHSKASSVPAGFVLREILGVCRTLGEAKMILNKGEMKINGKVRKSHGFAVGLFDIVELKSSNKRYRVMFDGKRRIVLGEINAKGKLEGIAKVTGKGNVKGGKVQLHTSSGITLLAGKHDAKVGDSIKLEMPENKISGIYSMKEGNTAYITGGTHTGVIAKITKVVEGTMARGKLVSLEAKGSEFGTAEKNVFVIGEKQAGIELGEAVKKE